MKLAAIKVPQYKVNFLCSAHQRNALLTFLQNFTYNEVREPSVLLQQKKRTILINVLKVENFYINKGIMVMIGSIQRLSAKNLGINF